jgi:predicted nucleic acid-binding OB-fold protein
LYELATGIHLVEWCSTTCAMIGVFFGALLIMLAHARHGDRENIDIAKRELNGLEKRLQLLEATPDLIERNENNFVVFMNDCNPKGDSDD